MLVRQLSGTASGIVFVTIDDETGIANLILFSQDIERFRAVARGSTAVICTGVVEREGKVVHVKAQRIQPLVLNAAGPDAKSRDVH